MESRVLTMSRGYVKVTEVMPANAPHTNRLNGVRSAPGESATNWVPITSASLAGAVEVAK